jgi:hypothetical protein
MEYREYKLRTKENPRAPLGERRMMLSDASGRGLLYFASGWPDEAAAFAGAALTGEEPLLRVKCTTYTRLCPPYHFIGIPSGHLLARIQELPAAPDSEHRAGFAPSFRLAVEDDPQKYLLEGLHGGAESSNYRLVGTDQHELLRASLHTSLDWMYGSHAAVSQQFAGSLSFALNGDRPIFDLLIGSSAVVFASLQRRLRGG